MTEADIPRLTEILSALSDLYRQRLSKPMLEIWIAAMKPYEIQDVSAALSWHTTHGDAGQFMPKPADVVKHIEGGSQDKALVAWNKVFDAIRLVGPWASIAFDDPVIHAVIRDLGGWQDLCMVTYDELPFKQREFITRYRAFSSRGETPENIPRLVGYAEQENNRNGFHLGHVPHLVGNPERAALIANKAVSGGGTAQITAGYAALKAILKLEGKNPPTEEPKRLTNGPTEADK